jgi:hypothetical protein
LRELANLAPLHLQRDVPGRRQQLWPSVAGLGVFSVDRNVPDSVYSDAVSKRAAHLLGHAGTLCFDASELTPSAMSELTNRVASFGAVHPRAPSPTPPLRLQSGRLDAYLTYMLIAVGRAVRRGHDGELTCTHGTRRSDRHSPDSARYVTISLPRCERSGTWLSVWSASGLSGHPEMDR